MHLTICAAAPAEVAVGAATLVLFRVDAAADLVTRAYTNGYSCGQNDGQKNQDQK